MSKRASRTSATFAQSVRYNVNATVLCNCHRLEVFYIGDDVVRLSNKLSTNLSSLLTSVKYIY